MTETRLLTLDPRIKVLLAVGFGILVWRAGLVGLAAYSCLLGWVCWTLRAGLPGHRHVLKSYGWFLLIWVGAKLALDLWEGMDPIAAAQAAGLLGLRLSCLLLAGLGLALSTSPRQLGMALVWFLRPVMGKLAWQAALALALMVHYLPITWLTFSQVRSSVRQRCSHMSLYRRMLVVGQAVLRSLGQKTWNQALAVACRNLDRPEAWQPVFSSGLGQWAAAGCLAASAAVASAL